MHAAPILSDLFVTSHGEGPPMLVMHGGPGLDHTHLRPGLDPLADRVRLVYYDHRGNGRSSRTLDWAQVSHESWARDADELREALGHERVLLFGHSYGAFLALECALRFGERLAGLVLCAAAPALDYPEVVMANARARGTPAQVEAVASGLSTPAQDDDALRQLWSTIEPLYFHRHDPDVTERLFERTCFSAAAFNRGFFHCLPHYSLTGRLRTISVPTLLLVGRHDWITPPAEGAERLHAEMPASELVVFEQSGHFPFLEEPDAFSAVVRDWLDRHVPA